MMQKNKIKGSFTALFRLFTVVLLTFLVCVIAHATIFDGNGIYFEIDKNPIERVNVVTEHDLIVKCSEKVTLDAEVYPKSARATVVDKSYYVVDGIKYGSIENNVLTVNAGTPVGSKIVVCAIVDGVESENLLTFTVDATPVEKIEFLNTEESITMGGALKIKTTAFPSDATNNQVLYSIVSDTSFMQVSYSGVLSFTRFVDVEDAKVTVRATSVSDPDVYAEKEFSILIPALETVDATEELYEVNQRRAYSFKTSLPYLYEIFGNKAIKYSINVTQDIATIDDVNGLLYILPNAPIDTEITLTVEAVDGTVSYQQELIIAKVFATEFAPVVETPPTVNFMGNEYYLPGDEIFFNVVSYSPINVTACNKVFALRVSDESIAYVDGNKVILKDADSITAKNPKLTITIYSEPNGLEQSFDINIFIPLKSITATKKDATMKEGTTYKVTDLIRYEAVPQNATYADYQYKLLEIDPSIVSLKNNMVIVSDTLPQGDVIVSLYVEINGIKSNYVEFNVYKPAHSLELEATVNGEALSESNLPVSSKNKGDTIIFVSKIDETATENKSALVIKQGSDYIDGEPTLIKVEGRYAYWSVTLKSDLGSYEGFDRILKVYVEQENVVSDEITTEIYIPNEDFALEGTQIDRGANFDIIPSQTLNATNQAWTFEIPEETAKLGVTKIDDDTVFVPKNLSAGTKIKLIYKLTPDGFYTEKCESKEVIYTVKTIVEQIAKEGSKNVFNNETYGKGLSFVFDKDSSGVAISSNKMQLWVGRYADVNVKYRGSTLESYGLSIDSVTVSGTGYESTAVRTSSMFRVTMNTTAKKGDKLSIKVVIKDGHSSITYNTVCDLNAFVPLSGNDNDLVLNQLTVNKTSILNLINQASSSGFNFNATYGVADMKFELLNASGVSINSAGVISVSDFTASAQQKIKYSCDQYYNGQKIPYSWTTTLNIKTAKLDMNGGSAKVNSILAVSGLSGTTGTISAISPTRSGYAFAGFGSYINASGKVINGYSSQSTLTASWVKISSYIDSGDRTVKVTDSDGVTEKISTGLSKSELENLGYKYLYVTINFDCKEDDDGYQDLWVYSSSSGDKVSEHVCEHGPGYKEKNWGSQKVGFYIALDDLGEDCSFKLEWGAHGNFGDTWKLGHTTTSITATTTNE